VVLLCHRIQFIDRNAGQGFVDSGVHTAGCKSLAQTSEGFRRLFDMAGIIAGGTQLFQFAHCLLQMLALTVVKQLTVDSSIISKQVELVLIGFSFKPSKYGA
jgi:hypothetical protein